MVTRLVARECTNCQVSLDVGTCPPAQTDDVSVAGAADGRATCQVGEGLAPRLRGLKSVGVLDCLLTPVLVAARVYVVLFFHILSSLVAFLSSCTRGLKKKLEKLLAVDH